MTWMYQTQATIDTTPRVNRAQTQHDNPVATYLYTPYHNYKIIHSNIHIALRHSRRLPIYI